MSAALLALIGVCTAAQAQQSVVVVADAPGKLVEEARVALEKDGAKVTVRFVDDAAAFAAVDGAAYIAAGKRAALALASSSLSSAKRAAFLVKRADAPPALASVALEPALDEQMRWLKLAFPGRTRVIVPRSAADGDGAIRGAAEGAGLSVVFVDVRAPGEAVPAVEAALRASGNPSIIMLVADPVAVTVDTVAPLAQTGLAARAPVVGFASYFLKVGALAAVSVDAGAMARQALALALSGEPGVQSPKEARLVVDGKLAERVGVAVRSGPGVEVRR